MKYYLLAIIIASVLLLLFPFLGLSEFWEYLFVVIPAGVSAYCSLALLRSEYGKQEKSQADKISSQKPDSLEAYVQELQERFKSESSSSQDDSVLHTSKKSETITSTS